MEAVKSVIVTVVLSFFFKAAVYANEKCTAGKFFDPVMGCLGCPNGTYMPVPGHSFLACLNFTDCSDLYHREVSSPGTPIENNACRGPCLPGYFDEEEKHHTDSSFFPTICNPCSGATPEVREQNTKQCPTPPEPPHELSIPKVIGIVFLAAGLSMTVGAIVIYQLYKRYKESHNSNVQEQKDGPEKKGFEDDRGSPDETSLEEGF